MTDARRSRGSVIAALMVAWALLMGASACSLVTGGVDRPTGNSAEANQDLAADLPAQIVEALPNADVRTVNYRDDATLRATLTISVEVRDLPAALTAVSGTPTPDIPDLTDPSRPLAPIATRIVHIVWASQIDPVYLLTVEVRLAGDAQVRDTFDVNITDADDTALLQEAFGPRP